MDGETACKTVTCKSVKERGEQHWERQLWGLKVHRTDWWLCPVRGWDVTGVDPSRFILIVVLRNYTVRHANPQWLHSRRTRYFSIAICPWLLGCRWLGVPMTEKKTVMPDGYWSHSLFIWGCKFSWRLQSIRFYLRYGFKCARRKERLKSQRECCCRRTCVHVEAVWPLTPSVRHWKKQRL